MEETDMCAVPKDLQEVIPEPPDNPTNMILWKLSEYPFGVGLMVHPPSSVNMGLFFSPCTTLYQWTVSVNSHSYTILFLLMQH